MKRLEGFLNESSRGEKLGFNGSTFEDVTKFIYNNYPQYVDNLNSKLVTFRSNDLNIQGDLKRNREWEITTGSWANSKEYATLQLKGKITSLFMKDGVFKIDMNHKSLGKSSIYLGDDSTTNYFNL